VWGVQGQALAAIDPRALLDASKWLLTRGFDEGTSMKIDILPRDSDLYVPDHHDHDYYSIIYSS